MVRIGIAGIGGRMGQEVLAAARGDPEVDVAFGIERAERARELQQQLGPEIPVFRDVDSVLATADVVVDFTSPEATVALARSCARRGLALVSGTTGLSDAQLGKLRVCAASAPVFYARNMSVGINALVALLPGLVRALDGYDVEIVETHHRHKADAPSGTALALAEAIAAARARPLSETASFGRHGISPRQPGEIGIHAVRGGGNAGEHAILFANDGEEIRVEHRALSRRTFALGAVRAAHFLAARPPGYYTMADLIAHG